MQTQTQQQYLAFIFLPLLLMLSLYACDQPQGKALIENQAGDNYCLEENFKEKITLDTARVHPVTEKIPLIGNVESNPDNVIHFISLVQGVIDNAYFSLGDRVTKGQLLAELRSPELSQLQSERQSLAAQLRVAERQLKSVQAMYEDGIASEKDLLEAQSEVSIKEAELNKIDTILSLYSASTEKGVFQIKAPASGIITGKQMTAGMQITSGEGPLFTLSDLREVWVLVNIYAGNVTKVEEGLEVEIKTLSYPDEVFKGEIAVLSQVFDSEERVLKARVVIDNPSLKLKPGMFVDVMAVKRSESRAVAIPTNALIFDDNQNFVVLFHDDCDIEVRNIEVLSKNNGTTYIAAGIQAQERFISKNQLLIYEQIKNLQNR
ncbi:efflux RND transporter periplasmic adaptor subunit [Rapidithrix thailandica]|uniref:Efflux RND transporter periplasmic adaptor subunit n=1 Tax=Rapidithrix thailandica TaxID=413964 RepID=A0AAW9S8K9_9BACT